MSTSECSEDVRPWQSYETVFTNAKAGMDGVDKEKVQKVVYEMSKGSKFFENEERKAAYTKQRIEQLCYNASVLSDCDIENFEKVADRRILELEACRDLKRIWMHVDMDAFYAAVETLENPTLTGKPMAVGSLSMICTANYEARKFGVRAAMPGFIAQKLCPGLIFVPTNFAKYSHYSELTRKVFVEYDPKFIARSLDEAYLDITDVCVQRGVTGEAVAMEIRHSVYAATGLTCSAGVAANRLLAKVCSDINKPNGQFILPNEQSAIMAFVSSLPIRKVSGIGKVTEQILKNVLGINTCKDLLAKRAMVCALFSKSSADFFLSVGLGLGGAEPPEEEHRKSISTERTFSATNDEMELMKKLEEIADALSKDMEKESLSGRTLTLKLKTSAFEIRTRAISLQLYIHKKEDILYHAAKLLRAELPISLRLMGIRISHFKDEKIGVTDPSQKTLTCYLKSTTSAQQENSRHFSYADKHPIDSGDSDGAVVLNNNVSDKEVKPYHPDTRGSANGILKYFQPHRTERDANYQHENVNQCEVVDNGCSNCSSSDTVISSTTNESEVELASTPYYTESAVPKNNNSYRTDQMKVGSSLANSELEGTYFPIMDIIEPNLHDSGSKIEEDYGKDKSLVSEKQSSNNDFKRQGTVDLFHNFSELMFWKNGYCCSLCGLELPSCFEEAQQEHSDYHLAEFLQKVESSSAEIQYQQQNITFPRKSRRRGRHSKKLETSNVRKLPSIHSFFRKI